MMAHMDSCRPARCRGGTAAAAARSGRRRLGWLGLLPVATLLWRCEAGETIGPDATPAGDARPDAVVVLPDAAPPGPDGAPCAASSSLRCDPGFDHRLRLDAASLGAGARLVGAAGDSVILAARPATGTGVTEPVVLVIDLQEETAELESPAFSAVTLPTGAATPLAPQGALMTHAFIDEQGTLRCSEPVLGRCLVVLLCGDAGCGLHGVTRDATAPLALEPIPGGEVPAGPEVRGLFRSAWSEWAMGENVCVFGDGIRCFAGATWTPVLEPDTGPPINDMAAHGLPVAVGDQGRLLFADEDGGWYEPEPLTTENLLVVDQSSYVAAAGEGGALILGTRDALTVQTVADDAIVALRMSSSPSTEVRALVRSGCVLQLEAAPLGAAVEATCFEPWSVVGAPVGLGIEGRAFCAYWMYVTADHVTHVLDGCAE